MQTGVGILCALEAELGSLRERETGRRVVQGTTLHQLDLALPAWACIGGVGKVQAARATTLLLEQGVGAILVVGTCGALSSGLATGDALHCTTAFQVDLGLREGRATEADQGLLKSWEALVPGARGWFLTADRAVMTPWRRIRLKRAFVGPCAADMETAAAAAVAASAGVPFAGLRFVTDRAGWGTAVSFRANFPKVAGLAANSIPNLLEVLSKA